MIQRVSIPTSIKTVFNHKTRTTVPKVILWEGREYVVNKVGLHHHFREGKTLFHVFSVSTENLFFRLKLDTDNLIWTVEEIADGLAD
jgi:hypothetical protein